MSESPKDRRSVLKMMLGAGALAATSTGVGKNEHDIQREANIEYDREQQEKEERLGREMYEHGQKVLKAKYLKDPKLASLWEQYQKDFNEMLVSQQKPPEHTIPHWIIDMRKRYDDLAKPIVADIENSTKPEKQILREYLRVYAKFMLANQNERTWAIYVKDASCKRCEDGDIGLEFPAKYPIKTESVILNYLIAANASGERTNDVMQDLAAGKFNEEAMRRLSMRFDFDHWQERNKLIGDRKITPILNIRATLAPFEEPKEEPGLAPSRTPPAQPKAGKKKVAPKKL